MASPSADTTGGGTGAAGGSPVLAPAAAVLTPASPVLAPAEAFPAPRTRPAAHTGGRPVVPSRGVLRPLGLAEVRLVGGFWADRRRVNTEATLEHCRTWMDKLGWTANLVDAAGPTGSEPFRHRGPVFADSEVFKLVEALAWEHGRGGGLLLNVDIEALTETFSAAQDDDGYLGTAFGRPGQAPRHSDLAWGHELYCVGHLIQAAVARTRTVGPNRLLQIAVRAADQVCEVFGPAGRNAVCGHPEIEPALVELYRVTGERRYLDQAVLFLARRGHRSLPEHRVGWPYFSDDIPVRQASVMRGHAVRALYLAAGAVDVAVETGDQDLLNTVRAQFARTLSRRTYLTGGMGSRHQDEAFSDDFVLPADRAYAETCAGIAAVMVAWRLLLATGDPRYADLIERILFNVLATAVGDDGRSFFYANTLHQRVLTEEARTDRETLSLLGPRAPWFEVSCCPPNVARILASLPTYLVTADADGVQVHQYGDVNVATVLDGGRRVGFTVRTDYPASGVILVRVTQTDGAPWTLSLRVPAWAHDAVVTDGTGRNPAYPGVARIRRTFTVGDEVRLEFPVRPRWTFPDPRMDAVRGCVAVERGPVVLCAESVDQFTDDLDSIRVDVTGQPGDAPPGAVVRGHATPPGDDGWPYGDREPRPRAAREMPLRLVPYHRWARRGPSTMRVWLPTW